MKTFSFDRFWAVVLKEFIQMKRDRVTFAMMVGIPLLQLVLFGYAINSDPKHLPTAIRDADQGPFSRTLVWSLKNSGYFEFVARNRLRIRGRPPAPAGQGPIRREHPRRIFRAISCGDRHRPSS